MGRVTGSWERPIQGVSQQADKDRMDGQCTLQENFIPSPLSGLIKRVGTRHINKLMDSVSDKALWYSYNRGDDEAYIVLIEPDGDRPRVFDMAGNERIVNVNGGNEHYYRDPNPAQNLRLSTIADYTFLLNTTTTVKSKPDKTPKNPNMAIVYCQYATYARDYEVHVDGTKIAGYTTPLGDDPSHASYVKTNYIASTLASQINGVKFGSYTGNITWHSSSQGSGYGTLTIDRTPSKVNNCYNETTKRKVTPTVVSGSTLHFSSSSVSEGDTVRVEYEYKSTTDFSAELHGNAVYVKKKSGATFNISTIDSADGNDLVAVQDNVKQLTNLPPYAPDGYVVKVNNKEGYEANSYWLKAVSSSDTDQAGSRVSWEETTAQDTEYMLDNNTLPHTLISEADGTFTFDRGDWESRRVGNEKTNPFPSFVDKKINSIGTFQNRMLFTSGESAVFSRTNNFFDFFRETTQTESQSDPIDAFADADEINNLMHHAVLDGDIIFFAENGQFLIQGSKPITKDSLVFKKVTSYPLNIKARPAVTGESIMFSFIAGNYAGIREMFTDSFTDTKRARPITEHVAEYIKGVPIDLISSPNINTLFVRTNDDSKTLYVYDWLWAGDQKVQSAMHKWVLGGDVLFARFIRDNAYFVIKRGNGVYLEDLPISSDEDDNGLDFPVRLDRRAVVDATWDGSRWVMSLPFVPSSDDSLVFVRGEGCWKEDRGTSVIFEKEGDKYVTYDDLADTLQVQRCKLTVGVTFKSRFIPTKPYLKDANGRAIGLDRFTLGKVWLNYDSIGNTTVTVNDQASKRKWKYEYNGRLMGGWNNRVGFAPLDGGAFQFPVRLQAKQANFEIVTEDYRPFILRDMEWEGMFKQRGRRL
ncbi:putative tail tubular protein B protein (endogenous virus) [Gutovirus Vc1]|uniref:Putative tail tubular protein B protein n=1 Tax=Vibrio phage Vc1 TaxID=1480731 RepID=X2KUH1_9CAUD|nr:tail protein [Vibrio phage Vc1]AHN84660.1 putative tail tubular protein B protein [Vibrio phage Vc1]